MQSSGFIRYLCLLSIVVVILDSASTYSQTEPTPTSGQTLVPIATLTPTPIVPPNGWKLIWHDEFDDSSIDATNWTYDLGDGGWGNGEAEYYTKRPENAWLENGKLVIQAQHEEYQGSHYTSARLKTQGLQTFQYGRIEARLKVPAGAGLWSAFWMLGSDFNGSNWPDCGEVDIMEYIGKEPNLIFGTMHGPGYSGAKGFSRRNRQVYNIADDFHIYAIEWDADQISWFYDGVKYSQFSRSNAGNRKWVFDHPFFIVLNLAVGGRFPGAVDPNTVFPAQLLVDYVRVYQQ